MSSNALLVDRLTRAQLLLQRHSNSVIRELTPILDRLRKDIEARLMETPTEFQQARLGALYNDLTAIITEITGQLEIELVDALEPLAEYQAGLAGRALQASVAVDVVKPSIEQIAAVVTRSQMRLVSGKQIKSLTLNQLISEYAGGVDRQIKTAIQAGVIEGKTVQQITSEIMPQVATRSRRQAETLVRTAVNHVGSVARQRTYEANADVLAGEEYTATLDSRTRLEHAALDGNVYPIGQGPTTPHGYNCRCVRVPRVKDEFKIPGLEGERASINGPVPAQTTYNSWLKRQPDAFQREYFSKLPDGNAKYRVWKEGGLHIDKFTDSEGVAYTLDQLKAREPIAFDVLSRNPKLSGSESDFIARTAPVKSYRKPKKDEELVSIPVNSEDFSLSEPPKPIDKHPQGENIYTSEEVGAIEYYKGDGFYEMNRVLRDPENHSDKDVIRQIESASRIDSVIEKSKTTKDHEFYRGIRSQDMYANAESLVGKSIKNATPQSTSFDRAVADRYAGLIGGYSSEPGGSVVMKIKAKKGSSALNMQDLTDINASEREILLKADSEFVVTGVETVKDANGNDAYKILEVEYVEG